MNGKWECLLTMAAASASAPTGCPASSDKHEVWILYDVKYTEKA